MSYDGKLFVDLLKIGGDAAFGIILAVLLFATQRGADLTLILAGAGAGMLPDALQFAHMRVPRQPLTLYSDSTSGFIRSAKMRGRPVLGIISQCAFVAIFLVGAHAFWAQ
jgi:hypothetical protein